MIHWLRRRGPAVLLLLGISIVLPVRAAEQREFNLNGVNVLLEDVTADTAVYLTSMRLNRAINAWNVEAAVSNQSARVLTGPVVLMVDSFTGTSGLQQPDGVSDGKAFVEVTSGGAQGLLSAGATTIKRSLTLGLGTGSPQLITRVFAAAPPPTASVAWVRSLDDAGQPLGGVSVEETGPAGKRSLQTDRSFGIATVGKETGNYSWKFSLDGYLPVWRSRVLISGIERVVYPRLTRRNPNPVVLSPLTGGVVSNSSISISFAPGAVGSSQTATLTELTGQTLPGLLPSGWSPLQAFWLELSGSASIPPTAMLAPWGTFRPNESAALARWNPDALRWDVLQLVVGNGMNRVSVTLPGSGAYALVVPDSAPGAPPAAQVGAALQGVPVPSIPADALTAGGVVQPSASPASLIPEMVTGTAFVTVTNSSGALPSGTVLPCDVREDYRMADGTRRLTPRYDQFIVGYQRPGDEASNTVEAVFPIRPLVLFDASELEEAVVRVDVLPPGEFGGTVLGATGGQVSDGQLRVLAGAGGFDEPQAALLRELQPSDFTNIAPGLNIITAFDLSVSGVAAGERLTLQMSGAPSNALFVIARVLHDRRVFGIEPVERLASDGQGRLFTLETNATDRLPGITGAGQYLVVQVNEPQGLIQGITRNSASEPAGGLVVRLAPWTTLSRVPDGFFQLIAPAGEHEVSLSDPGTADVGSETVTVVPGPEAQDIALGTAESGPRVVTITPENGAQSIPRVASVVVNFSRALNPVTLLPDGIVLVGRSNMPVTASLSLNLASTRATLLPSASLDPATEYHVVLSTNIADVTGRRIEGETDFSFTTVPLSARDVAAQLIIYEPGATNVPSEILDRIPAYEPGDNPFAIVVRGTPGAADPQVPVILVNESTGETTTVLSGLDGSFVSVIEGTEEDFVSATFVNLNGSRVYVPVSRQEFDDGFVGLYPQGGILEAESDGGPVRVFIEPNAIPTRSKFRLEPLNAAKLAAQLGGVTPEMGQIAGQAINLNIEGPAPTLPIQVRFPVDLNALGYPTNELPTDAAAVLAVVRDTDGVKSFEVMDQLLFTPNEVLPAEPLSRGKVRIQGDNDQLAAGFLNTSVGLVIPALGPTVGAAVQIGFNQVLVPMLFGPRPVVIKGKVAALPMDLAVGLQRAGVFNQLLNAQTGIKSIDVPYQLAQQMGLANPLQVFGGLAQQLIGVGVFAFEQQMIVLSKPLPGAFVTVRLSGGPIGPIRGRIFPGMVYATTGADGYFLTVAPAAGAQYLVNATHPLYNQVLQEPVNPISIIPGQGGDLGLAGAVFKNFYFFVPNDTDMAPSVSIANSPVRPAPGQATTVVVDASLATGSPKIAVVVDSIGTTNLLTGQPAPDAHHVLTNLSIISGGNRGQWTGTLTVDQPVLVRLKVIIDGPTGEQDAVVPFPIGFSGPVPTVPSGDIPAPDTNDVHGPLVVETRPGENGFLDESGEIVIFFNKPIDAFVTNHLEGISLSSEGGGAVAELKPVMRLEGGQQVLTLRYSGLRRDGSYRLTLSGQSIRDLAGQPLDQKPSTAEPNSFTRIFRTPAAVESTLPGVASGRGAAISGNRLYVLEQAEQRSMLLTYDITSPLRPVLLGEFPLKGTARDLVVIPQFGYKLNAPAPVETNDLVVVVGGDLDATINEAQGTTVSVPGQYLWVMNMRDPAAPQVLASPLVSLRVGSAVTEVRWEPPNLVYQEFGADIQLLGFVNLQSMLFGFNTPSTRTANFGDGRPGEDLNGDGDYVDPGETLPIPPSDPPEFFGKTQNLVIQNTTQKMLDFAVEAGGGIVGVTLRNGIAHDAQGRPLGAALPAMYRTLVYNGLPLDISNPTAAMLPFGPGAYPRWVSILSSAQLLIDGNITTRSLALVSLTPSTNGQPALAVIDISLPMQPQLLNEIPLPEELLGGTVGAIHRRPDGLLQLAGGRNLVVINPRYLAVTNYPSGQLSPAIEDIIYGAGSPLRTLASTDHGVHAVAEGGRNAVVLSAPRLRFVSFPSSPALVNPETLRQSDDLALSALFADLNPLNGLAPANARTNLTIPSDLNPPNAALHYHVLMIAPGGSGPVVDLGLEALNPAGLPLPNLGIDFAPVRAVSADAQTALNQAPRPGCGAPIRPLPAYRVSDDPHSPYYNWYLSRPFALITTSASIDELDRWKTSANVEREILFSAAAMRAFIDPGENQNAVVGAFAAEVDPRRQQLFPNPQVIADAVSRSYITGDNPPPPGGPTPIEDTYGTILSHSGEVRTTDIDFSLPSPRMPISIVRSIGNQDNFEGPFGVGWDFNYNQRLTILDPLVFPQGLRMPLLVRNNEENSEIAGSKDILFSTGLGVDYHFEWKGTNMPPEFSSDPLVGDFKYGELVSDYYLPSRGSFDLLVRFKDGRFERLTPEGIRYRYSPKGRLEVIIDRYPINRHELQYDHNGWLRRIDDRSVTGPRYLEFGYYRRQSTDNEFDEGLDVNTTNPYLEGKICRIRDFTGRDVLFFYNEEGFLVRREGVHVSGANGGFSGRNKTFYTYANCRLAGISAKGEGTPLVSAQIAPGNGGKPVAQGVGGSVANHQLDIPLNNSAATVSQQTSAVTLGDGGKITRKYDEFGNIALETISFPGGRSATQEYRHNADGIETFVKFPEGNSITRVYDSENEIFRSRGNLRSVSVDPGPRGGEGYTETYEYDPRYNLQSGPQVDANGFTIDIQLSADRRSQETFSYPGVGTRTASYNLNGQVTHSVDPNGIERTIHYDASTGFIDEDIYGDIIYTHQYNGSVASRLGQPSAIAPPTGAPTLFEYDELLQMTRIDRGGLESRTAYDELGRAIFQQTMVGDGKQKTETREYNDKNFMTRMITSGVEVEGTESTYEHRFVPDSRSRIKEAHLPSGAVKIFEYDASGNITKVTLGDYVEEFTYDLNNNRKETRIGGDLVRTFDYDGLNRVTNATSLTGAEEIYVVSDYYPGGQLRSETVLDSAYGIQRDTTYNQLDSMGRHRSVTVHGSVISPTYLYDYGILFSEIRGPRLSSRTTWDTAGNQVGYTDPNLTLTIIRDENGRVRTVQRAEDGANYSQFLGYNELDQQTSLGDLLGTKYTYDPRPDGLYRKVTNARGKSTILDHSSLGEKLLQRRADGMEIVARHNTERQVTYVGDPQAGFQQGYDNSLRMTSRTQRDGAEITYDDFDGRNMPATMTFPGGTSTQGYDLQGRMTSRSVAFQGTTWTESLAYDGLNRVRRHTYSQNGGGENVMTYDYDPAGPLVATSVTEDGAQFDLAFGYYADGTRNSITYPSGVVVTEIRDNTGRLTGVSDSNGNIISATSWQGNDQPKVVQLGATMQIVNTYDVRGRLTGSRVTGSGGTVLAHMRYQYDGVNNVEVRQYVHRSGRADNLTYDDGERLDRSLVGARPVQPQGFSGAIYDRDYQYDTSGHDFLTAAPTSNFQADNLPAFAASWSGHNDFLLPEDVNGYPRLNDPLGNVSQAELWGRTPVSAQQNFGATLQHDGLGRLVSITREDGLVVRFQYQPNGLRFSKEVFQNDLLVSRTAFVYDDAGRLIEEYDRLAGDPVLIARYYYASGDAPAAADLPDPGSGELTRYYFLRDVSQSIVAIANANGEVVERAWYDPHGQPVIEYRDVAEPQLRQIMSNSDASGLLIVLSEPVWTRLTDPGPGGGVVRYGLPDWSGAVTVRAGSTNIAGTVELQPAVPGFPPYSVLEFKPSEELPEAPSALEGWWPGDQAVSDVAGGHNGSLQGGATIGSGLINQAFVLNGTNAYVSIPDAEELDPGAGDFTIALWINFTGVSGQQVLIEKWLSTTPSGWSLLKLADNRLRLALGNGAGGTVNIDSTPVAISEGEWMPFAIRRQGGLITLFANGVAVGSGNGAFNLDNSSSLKFGSREGTSSFLRGSIDEVTLFSRALSDSEIASIVGGVVIPGIMTVTLNAGALEDEWGNPNATSEVTFAANDQPDVVYYSAVPRPETAAVELARSSVGSPFLFHGQYFDYETGLIYLRARYYDPFSGMFFEPDPLGYEDSVNHYAGMANNPASLRDPTGLRSEGISFRGFVRYLKRSGYTPHEIHLVRNIHTHLTRQGLGDIEIAAHVRVMFKAFQKDGVRYEVSIRKANNPGARMRRTEEGYQGKIEEIVAKSDKKTALVDHKGRTYTGDLDGLYLLRDGIPATLKQTQEFQAAVNAEMARLLPGYQKRAATGGQKLVAGASEQMAYHHGMSLNLPQEYGTRNDSMPGITHMGIAVWDNLELKMKKGTGEAFAFGLNESGSRFDFNADVDVNAAIKLYEHFYDNHLFNPSSPHFDRKAMSRYNRQIARDKRFPISWFPKTFYNHNYGSKGVE